MRRLLCTARPKLGPVSRPVMIEAAPRLESLASSLRPWPTRNTLGGVIHAYQQYDPKRFPSPTQPPPDLVSPALRAHAHVRRAPRADRRGAGPRRPPRPQPDRRPRPEHRRAARDAPRAEAQDPRALRNRQGAQEGRQGVRRAAPRKSTRPSSFASASTGRASASRFATWSGCGTPPATTTRRSPATCCSSSSRSARSTRSTSWPPSTSSPAARR